MPGQMNLVCILGTGPTDELGGWRHPAAVNRFLDATYWEGIAQRLEGAKIDAAFFADGWGFYGDVHIARGGALFLLDPVPLAMSVLRATTHLGVGVTVSSSFFEPYGLARTLGTVDWLSGGRLAWNVVTSASDMEAQLFGMDTIPDRVTRYDRATEVVEVCLELWDSFPADALVLDKQSGLFIDPERLRSFDYEGQHVRTKGPLNVPASPQGRPVIMQAGASERGREFAARFGEVLFTLSSSLEDMRTFYADMKRRVAGFGRSPDDCTILVGAAIIVAETEQIARDRLAYAEELLDDDVAIDWVSVTTGADLNALGPDTLLDELSAGPEGSLTYLEGLKTIQARAGRPLTVREAARRFCLGRDGGITLVGSPEQIADQMEEIFREEGADGFIIDARIMPGWLEDVAHMVVPELQRRGLFRTEYPGTTLRETLRGRLA